jgi:alpha/beta superfamily hydrolase
MRPGLALITLLCLGSCRLAMAAPLAQLRAAHAARDPDAAIAAYAPRAEVVQRAGKAAVKRYRGQAAIAASLRSLFAEIDSSQRLDLNFRVIARQGRKLSGFSRLRIGKSAARYRKVDLELSADGRVTREVSSEASLHDFEDAPGPLALANDDEDLEPAFYDQLIGRYRLAPPCELVVTRSLVRLFVRNTCDGTWRGLSRLSGREWTAGDRVQSSTAVATYRFSTVADGPSASVAVRRGAATVAAIRHDTYRREQVEFVARDGTRLAGSVYLPVGPARRRAATVVLHGSGAQDRNGYASIIAVLADVLAASGRVVMTFDKRGVGGSGGDWSRAGFDVLAMDAMAAMAYLADRTEVDPLRIGLAGSSQAGWVAAAAIVAGAKPADVLLLGAAGSALTVAEQNLYNTEVRMRCAGLSVADIQLTLAQQRAFFQFLVDPGKASQLDDLTRQARGRTALADWLFPDSQQAKQANGQWYVTLSPTFDPLPIWRNYSGRSLFLFSEHDDATPSQLAMTRLLGSPVTTRWLPGAQHLGLLSGGLCRGELSDVDRFSAPLFSAIEHFVTAAQ